MLPDFCELAYILEQDDAYYFVIYIYFFPFSYVLPPLFGAKDAFVLCRIFQKSGAGPKNGEKYGAPFVEEEWEDDELEIVPKEEAVDEVEFGDDIYLDGHDLEQVYPFMMYILHSSLTCKKC